MRSQNEKLSALRIAEPTRFRAEIIAALTVEKGRVIHAADRLNVSRNTLTRWLADDSELRIARRRILKEKGKET